jgi:hypothetical protein
MKLRFAAAGMAALLAGALATAPTAAAKPEDVFVQLLSEAGLTWPSGDTPAIIAAGKGVCEDFDAGNSWSQEVQGIDDASGFDHYDADYFAVAAVNAFCPEHAGLYGS